MKARLVELRAIHDLPSPKADAFMDRNDGIEHSREGDIT
jgi:hypothetical protein